MQIVEAWRRQHFFQFTVSRDKQFNCTLSVFCSLQWQDCVPSQQLQVVSAEVVADLQNVYP